MGFFCETRVKPIIYTASKNILYTRKLFVNRNWIIQVAKRSETLPFRFRIKDKKKTRKADRAGLLFLLSAWRQQTSNQYILPQLRSSRRKPWLDLPGHSTWIIQNIYFHTRESAFFFLSQYLFFKQHPYFFWRTRCSRLMFSTHWSSLPCLCIPTVTKSTSSGAMHLWKACSSGTRYAHKQQKKTETCFI